MGETRRPPCSLAICTSWDLVSCKEVAPCSTPSGPRHWALALEEFGKGTEGSFVNNLTHTLRPGSLCTVQGQIGRASSVLDLCVCVRFLSSCGEWGYSSLQGTGLSFWRLLLFL